MGRIVIADDHEIVRAGLREILVSDRRLAVLGEASNGHEALALCRALRPDLIVLDVRMPDMDGLSATRAIRRECARTAVLLFSVFEDPEYIVDSLRAGAAGYLLKGAPRYEILDGVRRALEGESVQQPGEVAALLSRTCTGTAASVETPLTPRERDVLRLLVLGETNRQIAITLGLTLSTVKTHVEHLISKLNVSHRTHAAIRAIELGLVPAGRVSATG